MVYLYETGLDYYGVDLSHTAVSLARQWLANRGAVDPNSHVLQGDVRRLPWGDNFFSYAVSHGVLDSMPWVIARAACMELVRVMEPGGLFYCDLISGDNSHHAREYSGEEIVRTKHEENTVQLYFNMQMIHALIDRCFLIEECRLIRSEDVLSGGYHSRYHLVLRQISNHDSRCCAERL